MFNFFLEIYSTHMSFIPKHWFVTVTHSSLSRNVVLGGKLEAPLLLVETNYPLLYLFKLICVSVIVWHMTLARARRKFLQRVPSRPRTALNEFCLVFLCEWILEESMI